MIWKLHTTCLSTYIWFDTKYKKLKMKKSNTYMQLDFRLPGTRSSSERRTKA